MKINKSKLIEVLLTLLGLAYLGVLAYLAITIDDKNTIMAILIGGIVVPIIIAILIGMFLDIIE